LGIGGKARRRVKEEEEEEEETRARFVTLGEIATADVTQEAKKARALSVKRREQLHFRPLR